MRTILTDFLVLFLVLFLFAIGNYKSIKRSNYNLKHDIETYKLGRDDGFKLGYKEGVIESQTALKLTRDLTNRDKALYWEWMQQRAGIYNIELK
jgi:hypothetical protein